MTREVKNIKRATIICTQRSEKRELSSREHIIITGI